MKLVLVSDRTGVIIMTVVFTILVITTSALRFRARYLTKAGLEADDWLALIALFFTLALNGVFLAGTIEGVITGHSVIENGLPVPNDDEILMQKYKYAYQTIEKIVFGLVKISILLLWKRLFGRSKKFRVMCWVMVGIIAAWMISFFFETLFQCGTNWPLNWAPIFVFLTECTASLDVLTVFGVTDIVTDLIIIIMPVPLIWSLQMPKKKKAAVTAIFAVGFFTMGAGVARLFYYLVTSYDKESNPDFIADVTLTLLWSTIELNVAMMVCCLPVLGPIFGKFRDTVSSYSRRYGVSKWYDISHERSYKKGDYQLSDLSRAERGTGPAASSGALPLRSGVGEALYPPSQRSQSQDAWRKGHGTVASAGVSGAGEPYNQQPGILARTEISTTFEANEPHAKQAPPRLYGGEPRLGPRSYME